MMFPQITMIDYRKPLAVRRANRKHCGPYQWNPSVPGTGRGFYLSSRGFEMDRAGSTLDLRLDDASTRENPSYGFNEFGDGYMPIIARLPKGRGFLAGATMGAGMASFLDATIYDDEDEARRAAHEEARIAAERQEEYELEHADDE